MDGADLVQVQFTGQHHYIGKLGVEAQRFNVGYAKLGGDMHLQANLPAIEDARHIGSDDCIHTRCLCGIKRLICRLKILSVKGDIQRHICLHVIFTAYSHNFREVLPGEIIGRMRTHIEVADSKVHGIRPALDSGNKATEVARRRHYFKFFPVHTVRPTRLLAKALRASWPSAPIRASEPLKMARVLRSPMALRASSATPTLS